MRLLPPTNIPSRVVTFSMDLPASLLTGTRGIRDVCKNILSVFAQHDVAATLGVSRVAEPGLVQQLASSGTDHEIAILGDTTWIGPAAGRSRMRGELVRRIELLRQEGCDVSTVVAHGVMLDGNLEVLVRNGINVVASNCDAATLPGKSAPVRTLRFGLWKVPAGSVLPVHSGWRAGLVEMGRVRRQIDRTIVADSLFHIALDGAAMMRIPSAPRELDRLLRHVDQRRSQGSLHVRTMQQIGRDLPATRVERSAQSILRTTGRETRAA